MSSDTLNGKSLQQWAELVAELERERDSLIRAVADHVTARGEKQERINELEKQLAERSPQIPAGWLSIETAPKDGTIIILAGEFDYPGDWRIKMGYWDEFDNRWYLFGGSWIPKKWMPLPAAPQSEVKP